MSARLARFAAAYAALWAAHDLGDHVVQTDHQAAGKAADWRCMAGHVGTYTATQAVALAAVRPSWRCALAGLAFSAATHAFIDRRWPVVELLRRTGSDRFAELQAPINGPYVADQALHHGCVFIAALIIAGGSR